MNPKSDGFMYTGINSVTRDHASVRDQVKEQKQSEQRELEPFAPAIFALIEQEKKRMGVLLAGLITSSQPYYEIRAHVEAVKLHSDWLTKFETQVKNKLRVGRRTKAKQGDNFAEIIQEGKKNVGR